MTPELVELIGRRTQPKPIMDLAQRIKDLLSLSRNEMVKYYDRWDYCDMVYRGERKPDPQDRAAQQRKEPEKLILPLTYAQTQSFVAFGYSTFNQRENYYDLIPSGVEDEAPAKVGEALLEQNLTHNRYRATKLIQRLADIGRFGIGVTKNSWVHEKVPVVEQVVDQEAMATVDTSLAQPVEPPMKTQVTYKTKYLGNKIINVSPYRFFPDVRIPLTRWSEGEFCADEIEESKAKMQEYERDGLIAGLEFVSELSAESFNNRRLTFLQRTATAAPLGSVTERRYYLLTEVQIRLNPSKVVINKDDNGKEVFLNPDVDCERVFIVWLLNDDRIVRIDEAGYDHEEFGYDVAQFFDDQNRFINLSLCEIISALQDTATWFLNARVTNVRKTVFNQFVVDEGAIHVEDIVNRSPIIRMRQNRGMSGVDNWIKQLTVQDVTANHVADVQNLSGLAKEATGLNDNLLGQFSPGRRSAKEASNVASYAASRLMMIFASIWESSEAPMGRKMLSNLRQGLDVPTLVRMYGQVNTQQNIAGVMGLMPGLAQPQAQPRMQMVSVTKDQLIGNYDFNVFNGTLPSQRQATAAVLMEWLQTAMKDPRIIMLSGLDPKLVLDEVFELLGVRNVQRFALTPERLQQLGLMAAATGNAGNAGAAGPGGKGPQPPAR